MTQDYPGPDRAADETHRRELAASIDAAADDLDANGPVPAEELRRALLALEAEWTAEETAPPPPRRAAHSPG